MAWRTDGSVEDAAGYTLITTFLITIVLWSKTPGIFTGPLFGLAMFSIAVCGMRISGRSERKRLADLEKEARDVQEKQLREREILRACKLRSRRRKAIREGAKVDDGLSDFGREVQEARAQDHNWVKSMDRYVAEFGAEYSDVHEDIFALEVSDKRVQAAWKRKLAADAEWEKVRDGIR